MKFRRSLLAAACAVTALTLLHAPASAQQRLRMAGNFPADHTATKVMELFKKEVEARTNGELQIDLFPNMQLGGAAENVDQVRSGTVFAIVTSIAYFSRIVPALRDNAGKPEDAGARPVAPASSAPASGAAR